jgi:hypothetical protein
VLSSFSRQTRSRIWDQFKIGGNLADPIAGSAHESAVHYWGNFHEKNLLLIPVKPDRYQVRQGQVELNLMADALDENWSASDLKHFWRWRGSRVSIFHSKGDTRCAVR